MKGLMPGRVEMMGLLGGQRRMKSMLVWIVVVSLAFTAGMYAAGGSWVRRGLGAHSSTLWKTGRPRHIPNWRESAEAEFGQDNNDEFPGLENVLERASMPNKTIIMTTLNQAWAQPHTMIQLFLESFREEEISHLLPHLVIVALDQVSYDKCRELHTLCYMLKTKGVDFSGEKYFMTDDYLKMMWRRIYFLEVVLEMGYSFVFFGCRHNVVS